MSFIELDSTLEINKDLIESPNLCDRFTEHDLSVIGGAIWTGYSRDKGSREKWEVRMDASMNLAMQICEPKNFPWAGCSNVVFPLVTIAALQFSARAYQNIITGTDIVKYRVIGKDVGPARERALRIGKHMSWQCMEQDEAWEEQHDRLLINLAIVGSAFIKTYYDPGKGYVVSDLVMSKDLVIDYYAKSVEAAARKTHRFTMYRNEIYEKCMRGVFDKNVLEAAWFNTAPGQKAYHKGNSDRRLGQMPPQPDENTPFWMLEQHCWFDFDKDGYYEPYTVTIDEVSHKVVRIVSRCDREEDIERTHSGEIICIKPTEYFTKYSFIPSPDGGIYDLGFGVFLGPINEAVDSGINQMVDFGTMQNSLGGLLGRGAKIRGGVYTMAPWEFKRVDSSGDDLRKNIYMWPDRSPPDFMLKLIALLIDYSNRVAGTVDATVGENPGQNTPASTFQGMREDGMQVFGMIYKRVWRAMKWEFKVRFQMNRVFLRDHEGFGSGEDFIRREDYIGSPDQIAPVANPRLTSAVMKFQQATAIKQSAMTTAGYDRDEVEKNWLASMEVEGTDRMYVGIEKTGPLPNPKVMIEQAKLQGLQSKIKAEQTKWAHQLLEDQRLNNAKIALLEAQAIAAKAQAAAATSDADVARIGQQLEAFDALLQMHKEYGGMVNDRIKALTSSGGSDDQGTSDGGAGVSGLEGASGNPGDSAVSVSVPGGSQVSVGHGGVSS